MSFILDVRNLTVFRGERCLIRCLNLTLQAGEMVHLVGPNGCGKTSLLRVLAGLASPYEGSVCWQGDSIDGQLVRYHQNLAWLGHKAGLKSDLTLAENLRLGSAASLDNDKLEVLLAAFGLTDRQGLSASRLSAGQRRRAALIRVLMSGAALWLLDEPFINLDSAAQQLFADCMVRHVSAGGAIIFSAHGEFEVAESAVRRLEWHVDD